MSKFLGMTDSDITELKGAALKDAAAELDIAGRSKMKADELRAAVRTAIEGLREEFLNSPDLAETVLEEVAPSMEADKTEAPELLAPGPSNAIVAEEPEKWTVVPNRKARREAARKQRKAAGRHAQKHNHNH